MLIRQMDKFKDPAMLLSIVNSMGLVGTTVYFYKQLEALRLDLTKLSQTMTGALRKIGEMEKGEQHNTEALHALNDQIKRINDQIEDIPSFESVDNADLDIAEIVAVLEDNNIQVERPSQRIYSRGRRSGDRRAPPKHSEIELEDRRDVRRPPKQRLETSRPSTRDQSRDTQRTATPRTEPVPSFEDDSDLIGEVRRQQQPSRI